MFETYTKKTQFDQGLTKVFRYIVHHVIPKYQNVKGLKLKLLCIQKVYKDLTNEKNIDDINENAVKILTNIYEDIQSHINIKLGGKWDSDTLVPSATHVELTIDKQVPIQTADVSSFFRDYFNERINTYEHIKLHTGPLIPPTNLDKLIDNFMKATNKKLALFCIIEWYIIQNNLRGIELASYKMFQLFVCAKTEAHNNFISEINSYLQPGTDGWGIAHTS
jgi:hypothetical protein